MAFVQRAPFAELGASRLQGLTSQKNCQNAVTDKLANGLEIPSKKTPSVTNTTHFKRPFTPLYDDEQFDSENVDPSLFSSKRSKGHDGTPSKKSTPLFNLNIQRGSTKPPPLTTKPTTPISPLYDKTTNTFALPSGTSSAPAGRSPKHKRIGLLNKKRHSLSPFKRIDPPKSSSALPFSIDAALNGTLSKGKSPSPAAFLTPTPMPAAAAPGAALLEESMPSGWFFAIHEDTLEEEAANLMEHSTGILDISSDDEAGPSKKDARGKENIPPADFVRAEAEAEGSAKHRRCDPDAMKDVGEERSPLGALDAKEFYAKGLDDGSVEVLKAEGEEENDGGKAAEATNEVSNENSPIATSELQAEAAVAVAVAATAGSEERKAEEEEERPTFEIAVDEENK